MGVSCRESRQGRRAAIARARGVSVPTVATQVSSIFQKLGACGRTELVALLLRDDLKPARGAASWSIARPFARLLGMRMGIMGRWRLSRSGPRPLCSGCPAGGLNA